MDNKTRDGIWLISCQKLGSLSYTLVLQNEIKLELYSSSLQMIQIWMTENKMSFYKVLDHEWFLASRGVVTEASSSYGMDLTMVKSRTQKKDL